MEFSGLLLAILAALGVLTWAASLRRRAQVLAGILRASLESTSDGILVVDRCGRIIASNLKFAEIWGISESIRAAGDDSLALASALGQLEDPEGFQRKVRELYGDPDARCDDTLVFKDGRIVKRHSEPLRVGTRSVGRVWGFGDVSRRVHAEQALAQERSLLNTLTESLPDYIYAKDLESRFLLVNGAGARMMGASSPAGLLGKTDFDIFPRELASEYYADERRIFGTGEPLINREEPCVDAVTGAAKWILTTKVPFRDAAGKIIGLVGLGRDITSTKSAAQQLRVAKEGAEAASRAKSEFLANMSHEIRTPMNGILGMVELALTGDLQPEQREELTMARSCAASLMNVLNDILDFSKIEAGKLDLDSSDFDLRENLETAVKTFAISANQKGLELVCDIQPDVPDWVSGDPTRLREIVMNLVGNAIKFTERGEVALEVKVQPETAPPAPGGITLHFTVRDTGVGISSDKQAAVFQAFCQADASATRKYGGTGLGLTISTRLVEMMGGRIWVESELGLGSRFQFTARFGQANVEAPTVVQDDREFVGIPILVVDDNATNRHIFEKTLRLWGMAPEAVESGAAALARLRQACEAGTPFRLVLTDFHMPDMDGVALVQQIRRCRRVPEPAVILASSAGINGNTESWRSLDIAVCLTKPVRQADLRRAVLNALGRSPEETQSGLSLRRVSPECRRSLRILLAEDNPVNQKLAVRLLEREGHTVLLAGTGREALETLERTPVDLVLMDVQMPEIDGLDATAAIREREMRTREHLPIIAMTAHVMKGDRERCLAAGMDGYLSKPIRPEELARAIEQFASAAA